MAVRNWTVGPGTFNSYTRGYAGGHDPLAIEIAARVGGLHALLEVDHDPAIALPQLRQALAELGTLVGRVADELTVRALAEAA